MVPPIAKTMRLEVLHLVAEEGDALLVLAQAGERQAELRPHQEAAEQIDHDERCRARGSRRPGPSTNS